MMGNSRANEKGKAPASVDSASSRGRSPHSGLTILEGNTDEDDFESMLDMSLTFAELEDFHQSAAQEIPKTVANPTAYSTNSNSFQNPQINASDNAVNANPQGVSLLPDWNMSWGQQSVNQGHNAISAGGISTSGGEPSFVSFNRPQVNRYVTGSSGLFHPRESAPVHTRNNVAFNESQSGVQGNFEGGFLSLRLGGTEESVSRSQLSSREISAKLKEAAENELKMARAQKVTGQTLDAGFMDFQSNNNGFSNVICNENQITSTRNEVGIYGNLNSWPDSSLQQNDMQHGKNIRSGDLDHFRDEKLKEAFSTEVKMVHAQNAIDQSLNAGLMGSQSNTSGFSNRFNKVDGMNIINNEVGVHGTLNSGMGTSLHHTIQMQHNASRNVISGNLNHNRAFLGNQPMHSGIIGGNSPQVFNSQQLNLNKPSEFEKSSRLASYMRSRTANNPYYAGQVISQNSTPSQNLGVDCNVFSQRTAAPQVSWVASGPAGIDEPFPKRLGVEYNVKNNLQSSQRHLFPMGTSFQTTSTGQVCQYPDKGPSRLTDHVLRHSVGQTYGAPVNYPINAVEPFAAHGQSPNVPIQLAKDPQGAPSANAANVTDQSQKPHLHIRPHHKRSAAVPHPDSRRVQHQKIIYPTVPSSMPKTYIPVTTSQVPPIPFGSRTQPVDPAARIRPAIPCAPSVRPRVHVASSPAVSHITSKVPEATPKLSGYKCYLCKRDVALTSEGAVYQPTAPPPVAILPCGHSFHDQCLQNITPDDQANDPPCIPCAIGEQ